eukprot:3467255-Prymnesium_polylepis.1
MYSSSSRSATRCTHRRGATTVWPGRIGLSSYASARRDLLASSTAEAPTLISPKCSSRPTRALLLASILATLVILVILTTLVERNAATTSEEAPRRRSAE